MVNVDVVNKRQRVNKISFIFIKAERKNGQNHDILKKIKKIVNWNIGVVIHIV